MAPDWGTLLSTIPTEATGSSEATSKGLVIRVFDGDLEVTLRDNPLLSAPLAEVTGVAGCDTLTLSSTSAATTTELSGVTRADGTSFASEVDRDIRPQVVGIFTDLPEDRLAATRRERPHGRRFAVHVQPHGAQVRGDRAGDPGHDRRAGRAAPPRRHRRPPAPPLPARRTGGGSPAVDGVVVGMLVLWHFIGANTSDDGYLLNMARVAEHAGYMANYFRWFGVPEAPFGWYYDVLDAVGRRSPPPARGCACPRCSRRSCAGW